MAANLAPGLLSVDITRPSRAIRRLSRASFWLGFAFFMASGSLLTTSTSLSTEKRAALYAVMILMGVALYFGASVVDDRTRSILLVGFAFPLCLALYSRLDHEAAYWFEHEATVFFWLAVGAVVYIYAAVSFLLALGRDRLVIGSESIAIFPLLRELRLALRPRYFGYGARPKIRLALLLLLAGVPIGGGVLLLHQKYGLFSSAAFDLQRHGLWGPLAVLAAIVVVCLALMRFGRRLFAPDAKDVLASDDRRFTVFIRSFGDEGVRTSSTTPLRSIDGARIELTIARAVSVYGPFVAIGRPGDRIRIDGAVRSYLPDDSWQAVVRQWFDRSAMVIAVLGETDGLSWEIDTLRSSENITKLVGIIPDEPIERVRRRWDVVLRSFDGSNWRPALSNADMARAIAFTFEQNGRAVQITSATKRDLDYELALRVALYMKSVRRWQWQPAPPTIGPLVGELR